MKRIAKTNGPRRTAKLVCRLRAIRESGEVTLTQRDLAARSGTTPATISETERGCSLDLLTAIRIAQQVELPIESIWSELKTKTTPRRGRADGRPLTSSERIARRRKK